ncbi:spindle and kinetochore-associated protein 2-like [Limulus polyphemus]|uniref:Protein FAM33A n=1 Tax=Limulus polyphemus TaxID=6850 RepID=A0ABM1SW96_LIMPO|nr:spindle and kinetochore-associated protein 2-like [Limulus polyphemus]
MEATVEKLEALFNKAESDLNFIECKLENELAQITDNREPNPVKMIHNIQEIKKEFSTLVKEIHETEKKQKEAIENLQDHLKSVCEKLEIVQQKSIVDEVHKKS